MSATLSCLPGFSQSRSWICRLLLRNVVPKRTSSRSSTGWPPLLQWFNRHIASYNTVWSPLMRILNLSNFWYIWWRMGQLVTDAWHLKRSPPIANNAEMISWFNAFWTGKLVWKAIFFKWGTSWLSLLATFSRLGSPIFRRSRYGGSDMSRFGALLRTRINWGTRAHLRSQMEPSEGLLYPLESHDIRNQGTGDSNFRGWGSREQEALGGSYWMATGRYTW